jgi:hypothetical protein
MNRMKVSAIIVSVDYGDILAWTLRENRNLFDRLIVITSPKDYRTRRVCEHFHVRCETTSAFYAVGTGVDILAFNKAAGINHGLRCLHEDPPTPDDWYVQLDADIILPPRTREIMHKADLDPSCVYGIDRMMCMSFNEYIQHACYPYPQHQDQIFVRMDSFPIGVRVARLEPDGDGYVPIGFFQMWNPVQSGVHTYPEYHCSAARSDMLFALGWPRRKRQLIPEIVGIHVEAENVQMGYNWSGRKSCAFGPTVTKSRSDVQERLGGYDS